MDPIFGLYDTQALLAEERPGQFREGILRLRPNGTTPFLALTAALRTEAVDDPEDFKWFSSKIEDRRLKLTTALTSGATTAAFSGGGALAYPAGSLFRVEHTTEIVQVAADPTSDTSLTIIRGAVNTTPAAVTITNDGVNPYLHYIGTAFEEGSLPPPPVARQTAVYSNNCQIQRNTYGSTRTLRTMQKLRTGRTEARQRAECLATHSEALDDQFMFGKKYADFFRGERRLFSGGILHFIDTYAPTNHVNFATVNSGKFDMDTLQEYLYQPFKWNAGQLLAIGGMGALHTINETARKNSAYTIYPNEKMLGLKVTMLSTPYGELVFKTHPRWSLFTGGISGSGNVPYYSLEHSMMILAPAHLSIRKKDYDMKHEDNLQSPGMDGFQSGFISDLGLEVHHPEAMFFWQNVANPSKDTA